MENPLLEAGTSWRSALRGRVDAAVSSPAEDDADPAGLRSLAALSSEELRAEWCRLYRVPPPPRVRRELLLLGVAWKRQERALGGLGAAAQRRLAELAGPDRSGDADRSCKMRLKPGARLLREWRGETYSVLVLEDGFAWRDRRWRSLSEIACAITGAHWSGPRFFGLAKQTKGKGARHAQDAGD